MFMLFIVASMEDAAPLSLVLAADGINFMFRTWVAHANTGISTAAKINT